jgi:isopentenyl diphosphate isomerase/L-lactate dehydrogenase-like FMN-dependent dehydrogenase
MSPSVISSVAPAITSQAAQATATWWNARMPAAIKATTASGTQNQAGAKTAPAAARAKAPQIPSSTGGLQSACADQGVGSGIAMTPMAARNHYRTAFSRRWIG